MNVEILQQEYERMQSYIEGLPAETYNQNSEYWQARLKELDRQIDFALDPELYYAAVTCSVCTLAPVMRVCRECPFVIGKGMAV